MEKYIIKVWAVFDDEELEVLKMPPEETCIKILEDVIEEGGWDGLFKVMECRRDGG